MGFWRAFALPADVEGCFLILCLVCAGLAAWSGRLLPFTVAFSVLVVAVYKKPWTALHAASAALGLVVQRTVVLDPGAHFTGHVWFGNAAIVREVCHVMCVASNPQNVVGLVLKAPDKQCEVDTKARLPILCSAFTRCPEVQTCVIRPVAPGTTLRLTQGPYRGVLRYVFCLSAPRNGLRVRIGCGASDRVETYSHFLFSAVHALTLHNDGSEAAVVLSMDVTRRADVPGILLPLNTIIAGLVACIDTEALRVRIEENCGCAAREP